MQEIGIDLSAAKPQKLTQELANDAALLITVVFPLLVENHLFYRQTCP
jgi:hypothetical protein